jgi:glycosyltransferase involved in cell wall biosynthesis
MGHLLRMFWQQSVLPARLRHDKPDLLYSTVPEGILFPSVKQIVTLHDIFPVKASESKAKMRYHFLYTLPILLRNSRAIICVSEYTKQDVIDYYGIKDKPIFVIYEGFDKQKFYRRQPGIIKKKFGIHQDYLLYIGDMRPYKNIERTLEAFKMLDMKDYLFVIGGRKDPRFYPSVKHKVDELSLHDRVVIPGYIPENDLPHLYSEATAFILPSLYEGFGLPPLEAMACGCPVIVSNVTSLPEVCGDAAFYIDPKNVQSIADGISRVLTDEKLRKSLSKKGFARARLFSWERSAREHIKVFEEVMRL